MPKHFRCLELYGLVRYYLYVMIRSVLPPTTLPNLSLFVVSRADLLYPSHLQPTTRKQRPHLNLAPILLPLLLLRMNPPLRCHPNR